jgi:hypothetical protein
VTTLLECIPIGVLELNITNELNRIKAAYYDILFIKSAKRQQQMFDINGLMICFILDLFSLQLKKLFCPMVLFFN